MTVLKVCLFGQVQIVHAHQSLPIQLTRASQALLAYLLLQRQRSHPRELLIDLFWNNHDPDRGRNCLNTALWRLRRLLEPPEAAGTTFLLTSPTGEVGFNCDSDYWLDVAAFEAQASQVLAKPISVLEADEVHNLEQALQLYTGDLLEGHYDDWALRERERLHRLYLNSLAHLMYYYKERRAWPESLACGQRILEQDPLREEIHREMMRLYLESGQRALAARQYELCRQALAAELNLAPMAETQQLYTWISQENGLSRPLAPSPEAASGYQQVADLLRQAWQTFNEAQQQLQQVIQLAEALGRGQDRQEIDPLPRRQP